MHRCEVRRIQGDIIRGARDTSQKEAEATALRFKKEDHRKQISRNRKQISRNRKQKGVIIQGQIPERSWQNPAVLEFCSCTSHCDGSIILEACTHLELSKATWKRLQVPTRQITCWVQNRSTMARAPSLKALARRHQGYLSSCRSGVGSKETTATVAAAILRRRCKGREGCKQWRVDARIASAARLRGMKEATAVAVRLSGDALPVEGHRRWREYRSTRLC